MKKGVYKDSLDECIEKLIEIIQVATDELNLHIPGIIQGGQAITQALVDMSEELCQDMKSNIIKVLSDGMVTGYVCKNAQTCLVHFEKDCSYTLIAVLQGIHIMKSLSEFVFEFYIDWGDRVQIHLSPGTVLYYTGFGLMHRQISLVDLGSQKQDYNFWNVSCYGNKRLFETCMSSFKKFHNNTGN